MRSQFACAQACSGWSAVETECIYPWMGELSSFPTLLFNGQAITRDRGFGERKKHTMVREAMTWIVSAKPSRFRAQPEHWQQATTIPDRQTQP